METVLGLSMTSGCIGWILLDRPTADAKVIDHDVFDANVGADDDGDIARCLAAVRGAQSIATMSGHKVSCIGVTWTEDADAAATLLLRSLPELGVEDVRAVKLPEATRTWARTFGSTLDFEKCAICVVGSTAITALSFGYDSVRTFASHMRESADGIGRWLTGVFEDNRLEPDRLFLIGSRGDLGLISGTLAQTLFMPIDVSEDSQLALARGAALTLSAPAAVAPAVEKPVGTGPIPRWRRLRRSAPAGLREDPVEAWTETLKRPARKTPADDSLGQRRPEPAWRRPAATVVDDAGSTIAETTITASELSPETHEPDTGHQPSGVTPADQAPTQRRPAWMRQVLSAPDYEFADVKTEFFETATAASETEQEAVDTLVETNEGTVDATPAVDYEHAQPQPAWMREVPAAAATDFALTPATVDAAPVVFAPKADIPDVKTDAITQPVREHRTKNTATKRRAWFGPHARAGAAVVVGLVAVFALGPLLFGQKDPQKPGEQPESESAATSISIHAVPSPLPPAALHQVVGEPAPALAPPPEVRPAEVAATEVATPVGEQGVYQQSPVTAEPMAAPSAPAATVAPAAPQATVTAAPAALPVAPSGPLPGPAPSAPAVAQAPEAPAAAPAAPGDPAAPPQDPVMVRC